MKTIILCTLLFVFVNCQGWTMVWNDEFNGNALNTTKWQNEVDCWGGGNGELQCYTSRTQNCQVTGGNLVITAVPGTYTGSNTGCTSAQGCTDTKQFTSARIRSRYDPTGAWTRGRFEIRAKLPKGKHLWPAFWMLPNDYVYGSWAASGEIDILEARGEEPTIIQSTLHYGGVWPNNVYTTSGKLDMKVDTSADYHIYACEWEDTQMRFYFDNSVIYTFALNKSWCPAGSTNCPYTKPGQPWDQKMHILLNLAVGGGFFNGYPALTNADVQAWTTNKFIIDYVRVYKRSTAAATTGTAGTTGTPGTTGASATTGTTGSTSPYGSTDVVIIARAPTQIVSNGVFNVTISYVVPDRRDIVVDILNSQTYAWFGKGIVHVEAGKGTVVVTVNGQNSAPSGSTYQFKAWDVQYGVAGTDGDWTKAINLDFSNVAVGSKLVYPDCV